MKNLVTCLALLLLASCDMFTMPEDQARIKALNEMLQTDADFSATAAKDGFRKAFLEYMEDDAVLLRDNHLPIVGADAVQYITGIEDTTFTVSWNPQGGDVSEAGDLGFSYGNYLIRQGANTLNGSYVTIWRRQKDGRWRYVLDAGTQITGEEAAGGDSSR